MLTFALALTLLAPQAAAAPQTQTPQTATAPAAEAKIPDTPPGKALKDFVASFNAGGEKRRAWVEERATTDKENAAEILRQDAEFLSEHGPVTVVRVLKPAHASIEAVLRHAKTGAHGHLTIETDGNDPYKVTNMQLRPATEAEIKGGL